ncbi:cation:proton antiporter [Fusobacterium sp. MFO224]|uniref:cation:proton antiporter n=1 Tax=Fusobacterium sp. MFO224 TaxID=3378070 RepID=UPI0038532267
MFGIINLKTIDPILMFSIFMGIVLVAPILSIKTKIPSIIYLLLGGMLVGPYGFNIVSRTLKIELLGAIGLLYIMFEAGLEINLDEVKKNKSYSLIFGMLTFLIPLILGILGGLYLLKMNFLSSLLLASLFSSHTLITYPIVSKFGLNKRKSITAAIGGTIITDVLALIILIVVIAVYQGNSTILFWGKFIILTGVYVVISAKYIPKLAKYFFIKYAKGNGSEEYVFIITITFILAHISHMIGLEPIIGAFLSGLILNSFIPEGSVLMARVKFIGETLFIPFFMISVGMLIDISQFVKNEKTIMVALVMIVTAIISKFIAALIFGKIKKIKSTEKILIFSMTVNQAAATLAAVTVGYNIGILSEYILAGTIIMIMITCFMGTFFTEYAVKKIAFGEDDDEDFGNELHRILVPINQDMNLENLIEFSFLLQNIKRHDPIYFLKIVPEEENEKEIIKSEKLLERVVERGRELKREIIPLIKIGNDVSEGISTTVRENRISKVVFSWDRKHPEKNKVFGAIIDKYTEESTSLVYILKLENKLGAASKAYILIPDLIIKHRGFLAILENTLKHLKELNTKIIFVCKDETNDYLDRFIGDKKEINFLTVNRWEKLDEFVKNLIKPGDLIIFFLGRREETTWSHLQDKSAKILIEDAESNFIGIYLSCNKGNECEIV